MTGKKLATRKTNKSNLNLKRKTNLKRIYVVFYEPQEFLGTDVNVPIKAFKDKKLADIYAKSRNFEFQTVALQSEEEFENYVLSNEFNDYTVTMSDLRIASSFIKEELLRSTSSKGFYNNIWEALTDLEPFRVRNIEFCNDLDF